jgi:hypothetical protein
MEHIFLYILWVFIDEELQMTPSDHLEVDDCVFYLVVEPKGILCYNHLVINARVHGDWHFAVIHWLERDLWRAASSVNYEVLVFSIVVLLKLSTLKNLANVND